MHTCDEPWFVGRNQVKRRGPRIQQLEPARISAHAPLRAQTESLISATTLGRTLPSIGVGGGHDTAGAQMDQYVAGFDPKYRWPSAPTGRR